MDITVAAIGRIKSGPEADLIAHYRKGLRARSALVEFPPDKSPGASARKAREGTRLLKAIPEGARLVALDEGGQTPCSRDFAAWLARWRDEGVRHVCFVIGGPDGLDPDIPARADKTLSLGPMTWPHALARVLLFEQLFRAERISEGHPYHRD